MKQIVVDTGPLVALLNRRDEHHAWAKHVFSELEPPLYTCEAVLSEACFLLRHLAGGQEAVLGLVTRGAMELGFSLGPELESVLALMTRFSTVPMSLADACLVRMSELETQTAVVTLDSDFGLYRRHRRQVVPTISL